MLQASLRPAERKALMARHPDVPKRIITEKFLSVSPVSLLPHAVLHGPSSERPRTLPTLIDASNCDVNRDGPDDSTIQ